MDCCCIDRLPENTFGAFSNRLPCPPNHLWLERALLDEFMGDPLQESISKSWSMLDQKGDQMESKILRYKKDIHRIPKQVRKKNMRESDRTSKLKG